MRETKTQIKYKEVAIKMRLRDEQTDIFFSTDTGPRDVRYFLVFLV